LLLATAAAGLRLWLSAWDTFAWRSFLAGRLRVELERGQIGDAIGFVGTNRRETLERAEDAECYEDFGRIGLDKGRIDVGGRRTVHHWPDHG
jgi:hypothetical protein